MSSSTAAAAWRGSRPTPIDAIDIRKLPLKPEEAYVLSRADGFRSVLEIANETGIGPETVRDCFVRLAQLGAVGFPISGDPQSGLRDLDEGDSSSPQPTSPRPPPSATASSDRGRICRDEPDDGPTASSAGGQHAPLGSSPSAVSESVAINSDLAAMKRERCIDLSALAEEVDLNEHIKRTILELQTRLDLLDHYEVLGVPRSASAKEISKRYYDAVHMFHPDRYYGKDLGSFAGRMAQVFQRVCEAYEVIGRRRPRSEYDGEVAERQSRTTLV